MDKTPPLLTRKGYREYKQAAKEGRALNSVKPQSKEDLDKTMVISDYHRQLAKKQAGSNTTKAIKARMAVPTELATAKPEEGIDQNVVSIEQKTEVNRKNKTKQSFTLDASKIQISTKSVLKALRKDKTESEEVEKGEIRSQTTFQKIDSALTKGIILASLLILAVFLFAWFL